PRHPPNNPQSWSNGWVRIQCKSRVRIPCKSTASVMELAIELRRRLDGVVTQLALSELPTHVQAAAQELKDATKSYVGAVQRL
ncbi:hypothetical protein, partial [Paraburkholderia bryophila]